MNLRAGAGVFDDGDFYTWRDLGMYRKFLLEWGEGFEED